MFAQSTLLTVGRALNHQSTKPKCKANDKSKQISGRSQISVRMKSVACPLFLYVYDRPPSNSDSVFDGSTRETRGDTVNRSSSDPKKKMFHVEHLFKIRDTTPSAQNVTAVAALSARGAV